MTSYDKKKYVCKMLYMYILGWEVDFGHVEAVNLIAGNKYTEKQIVRASVDAASALRGRRAQLGPVRGATNHVSLSPRPCFLSPPSLAHFLSSLARLVSLPPPPRSLNRATWR